MCGPAGGILINVRMYVNTHVRTRVRMPNVGNKVNMVNVRTYIKKLIILILVMYVRM